MSDLEELEQKYIEIGKEIENIKNSCLKGKWRAKFAEEYYFITDYGDIIWEYDYNDDIDIARFKIGNYFRTKKDAENKLKKINTQNDL